MEQQLGRFDQISNETYHNEIPWAYSKSDLDEMGLSPSNLIQKRTGPKLETDSLNFGHAFHSRLEHHANQDAYLKLVAVPPSLSRATKEGKAAHAEFEAANQDKIILDTKEWDMLERMLQGLRAHPDAALLLGAKGAIEETFIWQDKDTGVICKCRPDKRVLETPVGLPDHLILDWKTAASCTPRDLQASIATYSYHVQAAFYLDGIGQVLGHDVGPFVNVFVEKSGRNRAVLGVISDDAIQVGRVLYKERLARIAECTKSGIWPGFVDLTLPAWAM